MKSEQTILFTREGRRFRLEQKTFIPQPLDVVFDFFSQAENLQRITPEQLKFRILTPLPITMKAGALIDYRISLLGMPFNWRTEITLWEPPRRFIDTQLKGPYREWIHLHEFEETESGTLMTDRVDYRLPVSLLAPLSHRLFVKRQLQQIFRHRTTIIRSVFGEERRA